jgi:small subunit ribosomal protein S1
VGTIVTARITSLTNYGAFVEIEPGIDGLIHISDLSWTKKFNHPGECIQKGHEVKCVVLEVDEEKHRISLGLKQLTEDPWIRAIPEKYIPGQIVRGTVTKLTNFGVFVELEPDLEGLLHISELSDEKIDSPQDVVKIGDTLEVKILRVDTDARKIGLSLRRVRWAAEDQAASAGGEDKSARPAAEEPKAESQQRRGGLDGTLMPGNIKISPDRQD